MSKATTGEELDMELVEGNIEAIQSELENVDGDGSAFSSFSGVDLPSRDDRVTGVSVDIEAVFDESMNVQYNTYVLREQLDMDSFVPGDVPVASSEDLTTLDEVIGTSGVFNELVHIISAVQDMPKEDASHMMEYEFVCTQSFPHDHDPDTDFVKFTLMTEI